MGCIARYGTFFLMDGDGGERQMGDNPVENLYQLLGTSRLQNAFRRKGVVTESARAPPPLLLK